MFPVHLVHRPGGDRGLDERSHLVRIGGLSRFPQPRGERVARGRELGQAAADRARRSKPGLLAPVPLPPAPSPLSPFFLPPSSRDLVCHTPCVELFSRTPNKACLAVATTWRRRKDDSHGAGTSAGRLTVSNWRSMAERRGVPRAVPRRDTPLQSPLCAGCRAREARYGFRDEAHPEVDRPRTLCFDCFRMEIGRRQAVAAHLARGWNAAQVRLPLDDTLKSSRSAGAARRSLRGMLWSDREGIRGQALPSPES